MRREFSASSAPGSQLRVVYATDEELANHESRLDLVQKKGGSCLWRA